LVEQRTENPRVGGSIPPLGTTPSFPYKRDRRVSVDFGKLGPTKRGVGISVVSDNLLVSN
jgi:hypothetical protein